jgi:hypothetical protein
MFGFSVMARPDYLAEFLGVVGFFISGLYSRRAFILGGLILATAVLTKQTAIEFLLAAALALFLEGKRSRALVLLGGTIATVVSAVAVATFWLEPRMARDLLGESHTPWNFDTWLITLVHMIRWSPDAFLWAGIGIVLWTSQRPRDVRSLTLAFWIIAVSLLSSAKRGADLNYYMSFRVFETLAAGTLWHVAADSKTRRGTLALAISAAMVAMALLPSTVTALGLAQQAVRIKATAHDRAHQTVSTTYRKVIRMARDPNFHLLTDSALFDAAQRERAVFGDPWLFHLLIETGQINPETIKRRIETEYYDLIVTTTDLMRPEYAKYELALPAILVQPIREHYVSHGSQAGLFFYTAITKVESSGIPVANP